MWITTLLTLGRAFGAILMASSFAETRDPELADRLHVLAGHVIQERIDLADSVGLAWATSD